MNQRYWNYSNYFFTLGVACDDEEDESQKSCHDAYHNQGEVIVLLTTMIQIGSDYCKRKSQIAGSRTGKREYLI